MDTPKNLIVFEKVKELLAKEGITNIIISCASDEGIGFSMADGDMNILFGIECDNLPQNNNAYKFYSSALEIVTKLKNKNNPNVN